MKLPLDKCSSCDYILGMPSKKQKTEMIPPLLTGRQVAKMLDVNPVTIQRRFAAGKYPGSYKPGGKTSTILIPSSLFPEEQVKAFLKVERVQSGD